jgi:hypothetical protein
VDAPALRFESERVVLALAFAVALEGMDFPAEVAQGPVQVAFE